MPTVYARTLRRAAEIMGVEKLTTELGVRSEDLAGWLQGTNPVPPEIFLRAVDIVAADELVQISGKHPTVKGAPSNASDEPA